MALLNVYDLIREGGSRVMTLIKCQPLLQRSLDYVNNHPWALLGVATGAIVTYKIITRPHNLPPGPFNLPFIGPVALLRDDMEVKLLELRATYGEVIYSTFFGNDTVFLNSERVIRDAFVRRGEEFSHRRGSPFFEALGLSKDEIFTAPYNSEWKANKKFAVMALKNCGFGNAKSELKINHGIDKLVTIFYERGGQPFSPLEMFKLSAAAMIYSIYFNEDLHLEDQKLLRFTSNIKNIMTSITGGLFLHDYILVKIPILRDLVCHSSVKLGSRAIQAILDDLRGIIKKRRTTFDSSEVRDVLDHYIMHKGHIEDDIIASNFVSFLPDAIDTTSLVKSWLLFYIAYYPDIQRKLKEQVDKVIGPNRQPSVSDKANLPYAEAVLLETMRCCNILPLGPCRVTENDIVFDGYNIPKGTNVMPSYYSVHFDPEIFPDPEEFNPTRFLDMDGKLNDRMASHIFLFSVGNRMCLGEQYSKSMILLTLVRLTQKFDITFDPNQPKPSLLPSRQVFFRAPAEHQLCIIPRACHSG